MDSFKENIMGCVLVGEALLVLLTMAMQAMTMVNTVACISLSASGNGLLACKLTRLSLY